MSKLKLKSDENLNAAQLLINNQKYNSSVHCSYYGCFQFMKSILCNNLKIGYNLQDAKKGSDTHDYIFGLLLHTMDNFSMQRKFRSNFSGLKEKRKRADYENALIDITDSLNAIEEARIIMSNLKQAFGPLNI
ncbi:hypothetical protein FACS189474_3500 [Bacteroidia bacterium]|nr:hypothetical protein FACS189474_3500 [Bacteroidia bacterium]